MRSTRPAALLIHGLGGTVYDLGSLGRTLEEADIVTHAPLLPGHGTNPEDLMGIPWQAWVDAMRAEYRALKKRHHVVHLAGVCLGGLVALEVARLEKHQDKLALYAAPIFLDGWTIPKHAFLRHAAYLVPGMTEKRRVPEADPFGIKNPRIRKLIQTRFEKGERFHYAYIPLSCVREVDRLRRQLKPRLHEITCPTLVVHAEEDDITSLRSALYLQSHLGGPVDFMRLTDSYHMIMLDNERMQVLARSVDFFKASTASQTSGQADKSASPSEENSWQGEPAAV